MRRRRQLMPRHRTAVRAAAAWLETESDVCSRALSSGSAPSWQQLLAAVVASLTTPGRNALAAQAFVSCMLAGLIWTIQLVRLQPTP
jgi:hypothetical protein